MRGTGSGPGATDLYLFLKLLYFYRILVQFHNICASIFGRSLHTLQCFFNTCLNLAHLRIPINWRIKKENRYFFVVHMYLSIAYRVAPKS